MTLNTTTTTTLTFILTTIHILYTIYKIDIATLKLFSLLKEKEYIEITANWVEGETFRIPY